MINILPESCEAEQAVIGLLLHDNDYIKPIRDTLKVEHFSDPLLAELYKNIHTGISKKQVVEPIALKKSMAATVKEFGLNADAFADSLAEIIYTAPKGAAIAEYAELIIDTSIRRELIRVNQKGANQATSNYDLNAPAILDEQLSELVRIQRQGTGQAKFATTQDAVQALFNPDRPATIATGFDTLDRIAQLPRGGITLLGGRASMGKSALFIEMAFNAARRGLRVDLFSMEMNRQQIAARAISSAIARESEAHTGMVESVSYRRIYEQRYNETEKTDIRRIARLLPTLNFDDTPRLTVSDIKARCADRPEKMDLVFIDYLNIMSLDDCKSVDRHDQKLGLVASRLRDFAKDTGAAVILLCQLNRGNLSRDNNVPQLHDLRDSGELEQHADTVLFVHREHYYRKRELEAKQAAGQRVSDEEFHEVDQVAHHFDVIVAKQRMGEIGKALLKADIEYNYIRSAAL